MMKETQHENWPCIMYSSVNILQPLFLGFTTKKIKVVLHNQMIQYPCESAHEYMYV